MRSHKLVGIVSIILFATMACKLTSASSDETVAPTEPPAIDFKATEGALQTMVAEQANAQATAQAQVSRRSPRKPMPPQPLCWHLAQADQHSHQPRPHPGGGRADLYAGSGHRRHPAGAGFSGDPARAGRRRHHQLDGWRVSFAGRFQRKLGTARVLPVVGHGIFG